MVLKKKENVNSKYKSLRGEYLKSINLPLREQLLKAVENDQYYRVSYDGDDKFEKMKECDALNEKLLFELFEKGIYPNNSVVGSRFFNNEFLVVETLFMHTADSIRINYFLPKIKQFIKKGQCFTPNLYAQMVDQFHVYNKEPQIYGSFGTLEVSKEKYAEYNQNRKKASIGLNPIEFDIWMLGSLYSK